MPTSAPQIDEEAPPYAVAIDRVAFLVVVAVVVARCTMNETIRDPFDVLPGADAPPRSTGATVALVLSLVATVPALLVLLRRVVDPTFVIRRSVALVGLVLLGLWATASALWAADRFMAVVSGMNWLGAMALAWAVAQLVRTPWRLRLVAGVGAGLLLVFVVNGALYLRNDLPALREMVAQSRDKILTDRGWTPDSFEAQRFLQKVTAGEMVGFSASPNTYAALIVVTVILTAGLTLQRHRDGDGPAWPVLLGATIAGGMVIVWLTHSRTALATPVLAATAFTAVRVAGPAMRRHARALFAIGVVGTVGVAALVLWRGLTTGTLFHDSLTFRWRYWVGAWRVFREHALVGVGWESFRPFYTAERLAIASEEVRDPHNFVVRFFTELGMVGGLVAVGSVVLLCWQFARQRADTATPDDALRTHAPGDALRAHAPDGGDRGDEGDGSDTGKGTHRETSLLRVLLVPSLVAAAAMALNVLASLDWAADSNYVDLELRKRLLYAVLIATGVATGTLGVRRGERRSTLWLRTACVVATLVFLLHNLIDFSLFETSGMYLFALVAGAAMGSVDSDERTKPAASTTPRRRAAIALGVGSIAWLVATVGVVAPIGLAEADAARGDDLLRRGRPGAADAFAGAAERVRYNADYAYRVARALLIGRGGVTDVRRWLDRATTTDPHWAKAWTTVAEVEERQSSPDVARLRRAYDAAITIDPHNVSVHRSYADALARLGFRKEAAAQLRAALVANAGLHPQEPKRLTADEVAEIETRAIDLER